MTVYDYAIVGAGSAGCVLANRLSAAADKSVCLLEAGGNDRSPLLHIPAGWAANFNNPAVDWGYYTAPEPQLNDREIFWPRGRVLGGSSAINGMIYIRGNARDFADWAQAGAVGWDYEDVLPYFRKAEQQQRMDDEYHGTAGPLHVQDVRDQRPIHDTLLQAMQDYGIPANPDFNGAEQAGCGYYQFTQNNGRRWSTATAYLDPIKKRPNLNIITKVKVERIEFEGKRASGLKVVHKGQPQRIQARTIVLCAGSINSPQLLEHSGIGQGERLHTLGIPVVHNAPDVGEHLQDHLLTKVVYGTHPEHSLNREVQGWRLAPTALKWLFARRGPLTTGSAPIGAFWSTRTGLEEPDLQLHVASGATLYNQDGRIRALDRPALTAVVNQNRPQSRGSVHIRTNMASDAPLIQANYLSAAADQECMVAGLKLLLDVFRQEALEDYLTGRLAPAEDVDIYDDEALLEYIRADATTTYHPTSTCAIGKVVDANLRVIGVEGLAIADASVMPNVVSGNTNAATIMIAEKAADLLAG